MDLGHATIKDAEAVEKAQLRKAESKIKNKESKNIIISFIRWIGWLIFIGGFLIGGNARFLGDVYIISGAIGGILIVAAAEGLDLLQRIYINTKK